MHHLPFHTQHGTPTCSLCLSPCTRNSSGTGRGNSSFVFNFSICSWSIVFLYYKLLTFLVCQALSLLQSVLLFLLPLTLPLVAQQQQTHAIMPLRSAQRNADNGKIITTPNILQLNIDGIQKSRSNLSNTSLNTTSILQSSGNKLKQKKTTHHIPGCTPFRSDRHTKGGEELIYHSTHKQAVRVRRWRETEDVQMGEEGRPLQQPQPCPPRGGLTPVIFAASRPRAAATWAGGLLALWALLTLLTLAGDIESNPGATNKIHMSFL